MEPGFKLRLKDRVDRPVAFEAVERSKGVSANPDRKMGLSLRPGACVSGMKVRLIGHFQFYR